MIFTFTVPDETNVVVHVDFDFIIVASFTHCKDGRVDYRSVNNKNPT